MGFCLAFKQTLSLAYTVCVSESAASILGNTASSLCDGRLANIPLLLVVLSSLLGLATWLRWPNRAQVQPAAICVA